MSGGSREVVLGGKVGQDGRGDLGEGSTSVKPVEEVCVDCGGLEEVGPKSEMGTLRLNETEKKTMVYGRRNKSTGVIIKSPIREMEQSCREAEFGDKEFIFDTNKNLETIRRRAIAAGKRPMAQMPKHAYPMQVSDLISVTQIRVTNRALLRTEVYKEANEICQMGKRLGVSLITREEDILDQLIEMKIRDRETRKGSNDSRKREGVLNVT